MPSRLTGLRGLTVVAILIVAAAAAVALLLVVRAGHQQPPSSLTQRRAARGPKPARGIHKIRHVIVVMQENRSFDSYFGTFPGADGIPMVDGKPTVCVPDPSTGGCVAPYHDPAEVNGGGPHGHVSAVQDLDHGAMDGFVAAARRARRTCLNVNDPACELRATPDVMGWHDAREIPGYWALARRYTLADHLFESTSSWSLPAHLYLVSEWSASCLTPFNARSCVDDIGYDVTDPIHPWQRTPGEYAWTDLTYLLHRADVSWRYYVHAGPQPDCTHDEAITCAEPHQSAITPGIWNPLPWFATVYEDHQIGDILPTDNFSPPRAAATCPPSPGSSPTTPTPSTRPSASAPGSAT